MKLSLLKNKMTRNRIISAGLVLAIVLAVPAMEWLPEIVSGSFEVQAIAEHEQIKNEAENNLDEVNNQIDDVQDAQDELEDEISETKRKRRNLEKKIASTNEELNAILEELNKLNGQIEVKQGEIEQAAQDLVVAQEELDEEYESMKLRIQFMYENNQQDSFWSAILEADGLVDMLTRVEYMADVYESDRKLMNKYQNTLQEVEDLNVQLAQEMAELVDLQAKTEETQGDLETKIASLKDDEAKLASLISDLESQQSTYETQLARFEDLKSQYQNTISEQEEIIRRLEAEAARQNADTYEGGGSGEANTLGSAAYLTDDSYNPSPVTDVTGAQIVEYAERFVGNPYKWGGNSLTKGADCSGFVHLIYEHFGISTPRYSQSFKASGQPVSYNNIQPGDVVVYDGHVAIYKGDGKIVEAQSTKAGITNYRSVDCHTITAIRRLV